MTTPYQTHHGFELNGHTPPTNGHGPTPPLVSRECYMAAEAEHLESRLTYDEIMAVRRQFFYNASPEQWDFLLSTWTAPNGTIPHESDTTATPPTRAEMTAHLQTQAYAGDFESIQMAVANGAVELTAEQLANFQRIATEARRERGMLTPVPVTTMDDVRALRRFIPYKGAGPAFLSFPDPVTGEAQATVPTHSHRENSQCGGFERGISAEEYVRQGGACVGHVKGKKGDKAARQVSPGWFTYGEAEQWGEPHLCFTYSDCPAMVLVTVTQTDEAGAEVHAQLLQGLRDGGYPVCPSGKPGGYLAAFLTTDPDHYKRQKQVWEAEGLRVELLTPGSAHHARLRDLDGTLPPIGPRWFDGWLARVGLEHTKPAAEVERTGDNALDWIRHGGKKTLALSSSQRNAVTALETLYPKAWRFDSWQGIPEWDPGTGWQPLTDKCVRGLRIEVEDRFSRAPIGFRPTLGGVESGARWLCDRSPHNPQVEAFRQTPWDGIDRFPMLAAMLWQEGELALEYVKLLVRGIVVRAHHPAAVFPYCPTIYSRKGGMGKGDLLKMLSCGRHALLGEDIFTGHDPEKRIREKGRGTSVLEIGEREGLTIKGQQSLKSFITTETTFLRDSYDRFATKEAVTFIVVATSNSGAFLTDTNLRRDPVIHIPGEQRIPLRELSIILPQIWAQACAELDSGIFRDLAMPERYAVRLPEHLWGVALEDSVQYQQKSGAFEFLNYTLNVQSNAAPIGRVWAKSIHDTLKSHGHRVGNQEFPRLMEQVGWWKAGERQKRVVWERIDPPPSDTSIVDLVVAQPLL